jgi:hypothetical protein
MDHNPSSPPLSVRVWPEMPDHIMALGPLRSLYKDREKCTTIGNMGGFSLSDSHFLHQEGHAIDFIGENARREVVRCTFSSDPLESCSHGCTRLPSPGVEVREVGACGRSVGQTLVITEGGAGCWW